MLTLDPYGATENTAELIEAGMDERAAENLRRKMVAEINATPRTREELTREYGKVWDTAEMSAEFTVMQFAAPFAVVTHKSDGVVGTLLFQNQPRLYFVFIPDTKG